MLTINSMDNTKSIRIIDIQSREIDPYTVSEQYRGDPSYLVQLFGLDEQRNTYSVFVEGFAPYFYVKIDAGNKKSNFTEEGFEQWLSEKLDDKYIKGIEEITLENHKKLYGFDAGTKHNFVKISFNNMDSFHKTKNLWYNITTTPSYKKSLKKYNNRKTTGVKIASLGVGTELYEAHIPPMLRLLHIQKISPSGWIELPGDKYEIISEEDQISTCNHEYKILYENIVPQTDKETRVPYKICSFDIEASSSHGDFPLAEKNHKKLAFNMMEYLENYEIDDIENALSSMIKTAYGFSKDMTDIERVYPKKNTIKESLLDYQVNVWLKDPIHKISGVEDNLYDDDDADETIEQYYGTKKQRSIDYDNKSIASILESTKLPREHKIIALMNSLDKHFGVGTIFELEGDKVTFIGSTFINYGETDPYLNHCICLDTCSSVSNAVIECYDTEREVLLKWSELIQKEDPDVVMGYNIFGFDFSFMFKRAVQLGCVSQFLELSRNKNEVCGMYNEKSRKWEIEKKTTILASGEHTLEFIGMKGRLLIDLYNLFRRDYNFPSYKLDHVSANFIRDKVIKLEYSEDQQHTVVYTKNMFGLGEESYVHFEMEGHCVDQYRDGAKFKVTNIDVESGTFLVHDHLEFDSGKKINWCLAKDDVTPQDIFRMTNEGPNERSVIAKYCIQDCNLVQHLLTKIDVMTGLIEMASLCSVPLSYLIMRGQGIKLTSFIAKKCREKGYLMPSLDKTNDKDGYEGAIVLDPKCNVYDEKTPVACVDYSSLYPSSMISENLCHSSKVWTKEYDLEGNLIKKEGDIRFDNRAEYKYVDVTYDTYKYERKTPSAAPQKIKCGSKTCRFAQYPDGGKAVMPSVLDELLKQRKATKKLIKSAPNEFMANVYDKRQLSIKLTANSLYGQTGAKTSSFYEKDVAASTTATGRKLLLYAKTLIEEVYGNAEVDTKYGKMRTNAEYIYGDTDSVFFTFHFSDLNGTRIVGKKALELTIELAQEAGALASKYLKPPHDLEYEKTFMPFVLLSKKRYVGMLYEEDPDKCKRKAMGLVLKRRDNAPIVKEVYGGVIDIIMQDQDFEKAIQFTKQMLDDTIQGKISMDKLVFSKSLRSGYKNPKQIAHKVLAERIGKREPGNKPRAGDRIAFAYIQTKGKKLQGDKIETPEYIKEHGLKLDYGFYITNQIMKPIQQIFALIIEQIPSFKKKVPAFRSKLRKIKQEFKGDEIKLAKKETDLRNKMVKELIFDEYILKCRNIAENNRMITEFF